VNGLRYWWFRDIGISWRSLDSGSWQLERRVRLLKEDRVSSENFLLARG